MRSGQIIEKFLDLLTEGVKTSADLIGAFLTDYRTSYRRLKKLGNEISSRELPKETFKNKKQNFYVLLSYLKKQGFISKEKNGSNLALWKITKKGREKLKKLKELQKFGINFYYPKEPTNEIIIVIFDIPEKQRRQRSWLRFVLKFLDFQMLQKSVWIGKNKIPEKFISDLQERNLLPYIQIFEISKKGTISQLS